MEICIIGNGGHARSVAEAAFSQGIRVVACLDSDQIKTQRNRFTVLDPRSHFSKELSPKVVIAVGDNFIRNAIARELLQVEPEIQFASVIHSSASISSDATIGVGSVVLQNAVLGAGASVGSHVIINSSAVVEHEVIVGDFASVAPGGLLGGGVRVGQRTVIGMGAIVRHQVSIGTDTVVGAGSYVHRDLPSLVVSYGIPARIVRQRSQGDKYL